MNHLRNCLSVVAVLAIGALGVVGCSNSRATCEADCQSRTDRCPADRTNCAALCDTYVELGDSGGCGDERLIYQNCVVDASCTTSCNTELTSLNNCVAANSPSTCLSYCRNRTAAGCGDATCDDLCLATELLGRATECRTEVDRWTACLADGPVCDAFRCLSLLGDANNCRNAYCASHPEEPTCM